MADGPLPYGSPLSLESAKRAMAAAEAEAKKNDWPVVIFILDSTGHALMMQRRDNTQYGSIRVAEGKARTALEFRRTSKAFQDLIAKGERALGFLSFEGITAVQGGVPIVAGGKIVGAIGVSGVTSDQDEQVALAGAQAVAND
ncbi:MAG: GlcG/HbpS family heme-binding protein [Candidatus Binataceae bacterium]